MTADNASRVSSEEETAKKTISLSDVFQMNDREQFGGALNSYFANVGSELASVFDTKTADTAKAMVSSAIETTFKPAEFLPDPTPEQVYLDDLESRLQSVENAKKDSGEHAPEIDQSPARDIKNSSARSIEKSPEIETALVVQTQVVVYDNDDLLADGCCIPPDQELATLVSSSVGRSRSILRSEWSKYVSSLTEQTIGLSNRFEELTLKSATSPIDEDEASVIAPRARSKPIEPEGREPQLGAQRNGAMEARSQGEERTESEPLIIPDEEDLILTLLHIEQTKMESQEDARKREELLNKMRSLRKVLKDGKEPEPVETGETLRQIRELRRVMSDERDPTQSAQSSTKKLGVLRRFRKALSPKASSSKGRDSKGRDPKGVHANEEGPEDGDEQQFRTVMHTMKKNSKTKFVARVPTKDIEEPFEGYPKKALPEGLIDAVLASKGPASTDTYAKELAMLACLSSQSMVNDNRHSEGSLATESGIVSS